MFAKGKGGWGEAEEVKRGINGSGKKLGFG